MQISEADFCTAFSDRDISLFVEDKVGDKSLKTKMTFKLAKNQADVIAFLKANSPDAK